MLATAHLKKQISHNDPLLQVRDSAQKRLEEVGYPDRRHEVFRYINLKKLYAQSFELPVVADVSEVSEVIYPECRQSYLVFVNGAFQQQLSRVNECLEVSLLSQAMTPFGAYLSHWLDQGIKEEKDPFVLLNAAYHPAAAFVYVPPRVRVTPPVQIVHFTTVECPALLLPRVHLLVSKGAKIDLVLTHHHLQGAEYFYNSVLDVHLDENAHAEVTTVALNNHSKKGWVFDALRARLQRNSFLNNVCLTDGAACFRHDATVCLLQRGAEAHLNGLWNLSEKREAHVNVLLQHLAPDCRSRQLFKGILRDTARSSFEGKIYVDKIAQGTDAFQLNNNLLLSDFAKAYSKPNLEIFADDVKASHGATVGGLDAEELFYLRTRGLPSERAYKLLERSFCQEILACISQRFLGDLFYEAR